MTDSDCTNCGNPIRVQIRRGGVSCSLNCDRALGIGKYAPDAKVEDPTRISTPPVNVINQTIEVPKKPKVIQKPDPPIYRRRFCTCGHPGAGCYC